MPFCDFQAEMGFLAVVSAVSRSLCGAEAVSPLAKGGEGRPHGLEKGCLEHRLSSYVLNLAGEVQRGGARCCSPQTQPLSGLLLGPCHGRQQEGS